MKARTILNRSLNHKRKCRWWLSGLKPKSIGWSILFGIGGEALSIWLGKR